MQKLGPCLHGRDAVCRLHVMLDAGVTDVTDYGDAIRDLEVRWRQSDRPDVHIGVWGERERDFCQCLIDYARGKMLDWLYGTEAPSAEERERVGLAIACALGADRNAVLPRSTP
jgi:hypothetical protein